MNEMPVDIDRLIQDVLTELGFSADPKEIAKRVRGLNRGLPAEDEFSVICAWLGKCRLIHKLDQQQSPISSRTHFQVPDLLATFDAGGPVLIEVKTSNDRTLSFKPDYYSRLRRYADLLNLPLLIAWKYHTVWTLFDIDHATLAHKNYNITHSEAMRQNLLGVLAGDVAYKLGEGSGLHLEIAKEALIKSEREADGYTETWQMRISDIRFAGPGGELRTDLHTETTQLLALWDLESSEEHHPTYIRQSFTVGPEGMEFAHRVLVKLLEWEGGVSEPATWRSLLRAEEISRSIARFDAALERGMREGIVSHIFHQQPVSKPRFLGDE